MVGWVIWVQGGWRCCGFSKFSVDVYLGVLDECVTSHHLLHRWLMSVHSFYVGVVRNSLVFFDLSVQLFLNFCGVVHL